MLLSLMLFPYKYINITKEQDFIVATINDNKLNKFNTKLLYKKIEITVGINPAKIKVTNIIVNTL